MTMKTHWNGSKTGANNKKGSATYESNTSRRRTRNKDIKNG